MIREMNVRRGCQLLCLLAGVALLVGCDGGRTERQSSTASAGRPNVLLVVWDTVRADHLSLYGYERSTTPHLDEWARQARVYDNCVSAGSTTVPAHVSMFTGLLPSEHQVDNNTDRMSDSISMLAELLKQVGYGTYLFSENPYLSAQNNFTQGFDFSEHPWSPQNRAETLRLIQQRVRPNDRSCEIGRKLSRRKIDKWDAIATGELAQKRAEAWLAGRDRTHPFFIFLNYMESHYPLIPPLDCRRRMMAPEQVGASYQVDRTMDRYWSYVLGLHEYSDEDLELTRATYDAALVELDQHFHNLRQSLANGGYLENTVVILVSDHGEHLGEHHLLDHQFSVYEPLMRVPLVIHYPARFASGRDGRPVTNLDLFPTILELAGIAPPARTKAVSLLHPEERRVRLGEYPAAALSRLRRMQRLYPNLDAEPWKQTLRAYYDPPYKLIEVSGGQHELYNLETDPDELHDLVLEQPRIAERLVADLRGYLESLQTIVPTQSSQPVTVDEEHLRRLETLGYVGGDEDADEDSNDGDNP
jgi:arylsulfatase A-like enzyme